MKFTDRFIEVPIKFYNSRLAELTGKEDCWEAKANIDPWAIIEYYASSDSDYPDQECVQVYLSNGRSFLVYRSVVQFEDELNQFGKRYESDLPQRLQGSPLRHMG